MAHIGEKLLLGAFALFGAEALALGLALFRFSFGAQRLCLLFLLHEFGRTRFHEFGEFLLAPLELFQRFVGLVAQSAGEQAHDFLHHFGVLAQYAEENFPVNAGQPGRCGRAHGHRARAFVEQGHFTETVPDLHLRYDVVAVVYLCRTVEDEVQRAAGIAFAEHDIACFMHFDTALFGQVLEDGCGHGAKDVHAAEFFGQFGGGRVHAVGVVLGKSRCFYWLAQCGYLKTASCLVYAFSE
jgi:hypothetical protein